MDKTKYFLTSLILIAVIILSILSGSWLTLSILKSVPDGQNELIKNFYLTENAVYISPHSLRKKMDRGAEDYVLVDLRSQLEYEKEHIVGAINIPAYKDPDTSAYQEVDRIVTEFAKLPQNKEIIVYCYSIPCMTGRKIGQLLAERGIYVKLLGIGWNEWRFFWNLWNHEPEWETTKVEDYVVSGPEPGVPKIKKDSTACPIAGELSC